MKIIQERELRRLCMMMEGDKEMNNLAANILRKKEVVRFSFMSICVMHSIAFIITLVVGVYLANRYTLGLWYIPVVTVCLIQGVWSIIHLITIAEFRKSYNEHMKHLL